MVRRVSLITGERANQHLRLPERDAGAQRLLEFQPEVETDVAEYLSLCHLRGYGCAGFEFFP